MGNCDLFCDELDVDDVDLEDEGEVVFDVFVDFDLEVEVVDVVEMDVIVVDIVDVVGDELSDGDFVVVFVGGDDGEIDFEVVEV